MASILFYDQIFNNDSYRHSRMTRWFDMDLYAEEPIGWGTYGVTEVAECRMWLLNNCWGEIIIKDLVDSRNDVRTLYFSSEADHVKFRLSPWYTQALEFQKRNNLYIPTKK